MDFLITRGTGAGTDDRYHPTRTPVQHFYEDILPYLQCCLMSNNSETCDTYMIHRPIRRGSDTMGATGRMWGDPHFGTLDGDTYTFNGHGEYTYLAISNTPSTSLPFNDSNTSLIFRSQIRTVPIGSGSATVTTGFAAQSSYSTSKKISLTISRRQQIILKRGTETLEFENNIDQLIFPEMTIRRPKPNNNNHFILSWSLGVNIDIKIIKISSPSTQSVLDISASISKMYRGKTYGLLGNYNGNQNDDLRNSNGTTINRTASLEEIHDQFGKTWAIQPSNSLFFYESDQTAKQFEEQNSRYRPSFFDPSKLLNVSSTIKSICQIKSPSPSSWTVGERNCYYDYHITNDTILAEASLNAGKGFIQTKLNERSLPVFNPSLPLSLVLSAGQRVEGIIAATSAEKSNQVKLSALHLPTNATFNTTNGLFSWIPIQGKHYVSIQALDTTSNLTNKHDIAFDVKSNATNSGCNRQWIITSVYLPILAMIYLFYSNLLLH